MSGFYGLLDYEPSTLLLIWRNLTPFWAEKALPIGPNFGPNKDPDEREGPNEENTSLFLGASTRRLQNLERDDLRHLRETLATGSRSA